MSKEYCYVVREIPPSLNRFAGRQNTWEYRELKQAWKWLIRSACTQKPKRPLPKAVVTLTYYFGSRRRHDPDNYNGKMILDGLTDAGILEDDSFDHIELRIRGGYDKARPRTEIMVQEVESLE